MSRNMFFLDSGPKPSSYLPLTIETPAEPPSRSRSLVSSSWSLASSLPCCFGWVWTSRGGSVSAFALDADEMWSGEVGEVEEGDGDCDDGAGEDVVVVSLCGGDLGENQLNREKCVVEVVLSEREARLARNDARPTARVDFDAHSMVCIDGCCLWGKSGGGGGGCNSWIGSLVRRWGGGVWGVDEYVAE